jgi:hypothetical protein
VVTLLEPSGGHHAGHQASVVPGDISHVPTSQEPLRVCKGFPAYTIPFSPPSLSEFQQVWALVRRWSWDISKKGHDMMDVKLGLGAVEAGRETNDGKQG